MNQQEGAAIVIVAISLVTMIGMVGLVVDLGAVYEERRELSRGADAAVLAVAADCGTGAKPCDVATATDTAEIYAGLNADDGATAIDDLTLDLDEQRVWVRTKSFDPADGSDQLKLFFMRVFGITGTTVEAEAAAIWGYPLEASALPLIISDCEWEKFVPGGTPDPTHPVVTILFHDGQSTEDCNAQAGQDSDGDGILSGGFGWLSTGGDCIATVLSGNWVGEDPGASPSSGCDAAELRSLIFDKTVLIPYFNDTDGLGANGQYHIAGVGAFHITGYNFGGQFKEPSAALAPCSGDERCISGYFDTALAPGGDIGGANYGVVVVKLVG
ncbi:MAG: hypothetical protein A2135_05210 [Actinobacteria bacterium RBG_16_67_15]|nr:MAG: hypothetical protein A2135_05210 [Actinobacteria bacterium RBG_16_67_15]